MKPKYKRLPRSKDELIRRLKSNGVKFVKTCGTCANSEEDYHAEVIPYKRCKYLNCQVGEDTICPKYEEAK